MMIKVDTDIDDERVLPSPIAMTEAEYDRWDDELWTGEWIDGVVEYFLTDTHRVCRIRHLCLTALGGYVFARELGDILGPNFAVRVADPPRRRLPDLMFVSASRRSVLKHRYCDGPPDLVIEIVTPESTSRDYRVKHQEYEGFGIREYWIVDPQAEIVEAALLDANGVYQPLPNVDGRIASTVVPGWFLKPEWLWTDPPRNAIEVLRELKVI